MPSSAVMDKFGARTLHSGGPGGPVVTDPKQAVAIKMSEQRVEAKHGGHYPEKNYFQGGSTMSKSSGLHDASYAKGGSDCIGATSSANFTGCGFTGCGAKGTPHQTSPCYLGSGIIQPIGERN